MEHISHGLIQLIDPLDGVHGEDQQKLTLIKQKNSLQAAEYFSRNAREWDSIRQRTVADTAVEEKLVEYVRGIHADLLLDIGTGTGRVLEILAPHVKRGLGIDLSREMLALARGNLESADVINCSVRQDDINNLSSENDSVDVVTIHQVLHYLDNPEVAVNEAARVLRPGGMLLIVDFLPHQLEFLREQHAHRRLGFSGDTVQQWCQRSGLGVSDFVQLPAKKPDHLESLTVGLWCILKPANP
jgi:ArsR family transcriptional regulator